MAGTKKDSEKEYSPNWGGARKGGGRPKGSPNKGDGAWEEDNLQVDDRFGKPCRNRRDKAACRGERKERGEVRDRVDSRGFSGEGGMTFEIRLLFRAAGFFLTGIYIIHII